MSVVVRLDGEGVNWLYKPISFVPGVKVEPNSRSAPQRDPVLDVGENQNVDEKVLKSKFERGEKGKGE